MFCETAVQVTGEKGEAALSGDTGPQPVGQQRVLP